MSNNTKHVILAVEAALIVGLAMVVLFGTITLLNT